MTHLYWCLRTCSGLLATCCFVMLQAVRQYNPSHLLSQIQTLAFPQSALHWIVPLCHPPRVAKDINAGVWTMSRRGHRHQTKRGHTYQTKRGHCYQTERGHRYQTRNTDKSSTCGWSLDRIPWPGGMHKLRSGSSTIACNKTHNCNPSYSASFYTTHFNPAPSTAAACNWMCTHGTLLCHWLIIRLN